MSAEGPLGWDEMFEDRILSLDSLHVFFTSALVLAVQSKVIAEVGCGRGWQAELDQPQGAWQDLRGPGRTVIGIDVDPVAAENPVIDEFRLIGPDAIWPIETGTVDLAVSDYVLEHVEDPELFVTELVRILRPGGVFVARTVSRSSLLSLFARLVPNRSHARVLGVLQPGRTEKDVFPTQYKMNSRPLLHKLLDRDFEWAAASRTSLDQYLLPWPRLGRVATSIERRLPRGMQSALVICARKRV